MRPATRAADFEARGGLARDDKPWREGARDDTIRDRHDAWFVFFSYGVVFYDLEYNFFYVRAVRLGRAAWQSTRRACEMTRCQMITLVTAISAANVVFHAPAACAQPGAAQVLSEMGWSADDQRRVMTGECVTREAPGTSDNDLALSMAFLVRTSPADLSEQIIAGNLIGTDPQVVASGEFEGAGSLADLASST